MPSGTVSNQWPADFLNAHYRHWTDAETLYQRQRWANADHLYGLSAECGLKAIMYRLGMKTHPTGKPVASEHRTHINELWRVFRTFVSGRRAVRYASWLPAANPFRDWLVDQRYAHEGHFTEDIVRQHRNGAQKVRYLVDNAHRSGLL